MLYLLLIIIILTVTTRAADDDNHFTNPSSWTGINPEWKLGEEQVIAWETTLEVFNISFWQQSLFQQTAASQGNVYSKIHASDKVTNFSWVVQLYGFDLNYSNVFFFWINSDTPDGFTSAYLNITEPDPTSTGTDNATLSTASSNATSTTSSNTSPVITDPSISSLPQAADESETGLTTTAKVALGVGLGVGLPILGALAVLIWQRSRTIDGALKGDNGSRPSGAAELLGGIVRPKSSRSAKEVPGTDPALFYPELPGRPDI
ncbi:uncharacterized protein BDW70DRAFT_66561 [Aspergillus foveolatus]|uniref:uncharacterized protein n=1 Tax=Aspergillus foveolatus TaxID=210207 RepID=UPI003CCCD71A